MSAAPQRLLVVAPNWLGDAIMALPAIADLRRHHAAAMVAVAARPAVAGLFAMVPGVDRVVALEWPGRWSARRARRRDVEALRAVGADAGLLLPNSFASAWLVRAAGVRERWGYAADLRTPLLTRAVPRPRMRVHQARYYSGLVHALGVENGPLRPALAVPPEAVARAAALLGAHGWERHRPLVVLAPGAAYGGAKRWPLAHVAALATALAAGGVHCALVGAAADAAATRTVTSMIEAAARASVSDLAGQTSLDTLAGVMTLARACVSNDSGAMHLAGAAGVPLAALFGPTRERQTAPLAPAGVPVEVLIHHVWCRPCMLRECPLDHRCMTGLAPDRVHRAVTSLMAGAPPA